MLVNHLITLQQTGQPSGFHGEAGSETGISAHKPALLIIVIRFPGVPLLPLFPVITSENYSLAAVVYGGNFS